MEKYKKIIQRFLPITQQYKIVSSRYTSLIDGDGGTTCDNCSRPISNIAVIVGQTDQVTYTVGMDCAATLAGIQDSFDFNYIHKANFQRAKQVRQWFLKHIKKDTDSVKHIPELIVRDADPENGKKGYVYLEVNQLTNGHSTGRAYRYEDLSFRDYIVPMVSDIVKPLIKEPA